MKKQVKDQVVKLVNEMNEFNVYAGFDAYVIRWDMYKRGCYYVEIDYDIFYSLDLKELLKVINENDLIFTLGRSCTGCRMFLQ